MIAPIRTSEDFATRVILGTTEESLELEFKAHLQGLLLPKSGHKRERILKDARKELCRDVTQFANSSSGGTLLIGVAERDAEDGRHVAASISGVKDTAIHHQWIEDALQFYCTPSTFSREILCIRVDDKHVLAVNVPPSHILVAIWDGTSSEYIARTGHGKRYLNPDEVDMMKSDGTRTGELKTRAAYDAASKLVQHTAPRVHVVAF